MGRDGVLPRRYFGYLNRRFETPVFNIVLIAVIILIAIGLDLSEATSLINFGAFMAFTVVNVCVILYFLRQRRTGEPSVLRGVVLPASGAVVDVLAASGRPVQDLGVVWLAVGVGYLAIMTRGFRRPPPQLSLGESDASRAAS